MREFEAAQREPQPRVVARSVLDGVSEWWNGSEQTAERNPKPETKFSKQDFDQQIALVGQPIAVALNEIRVGKPDRFKCGAAAARLPGAVNALQTMAAAKKEAGNQANMLAPVADIQAAQTSLQVLGDWMAAPALWKESFAAARAAVDRALSAPVIDPDAAKDAPDAAPPPADGVLKADRDKIVNSVIPALERLIIKTSAPPFQTWDPLNYFEADDVLTQLGNCGTVKQLEPARAAVEKGKQAIAAYAGDIQKTLDDAIAKLESAQVKLAESARSFIESAGP